VAEDVADGAGDWPRAFWRLRRGFPVAISWSLSAEDFADVSASCMSARAGGRTSGDRQVRLGLPGEVRARWRQLDSIGGWTSLEVDDW